MPTILSDRGVANGVESACPEGGTRVAILPTAWGSDRGGMAWVADVCNAGKAAPTEEIIRTE